MKIRGTLCAEIDPDVGSQTIEIIEGFGASLGLIEFLDETDGVEKIFHCVGGGDENDDGVRNNGEKGGVCTILAAPFFETHERVLTKEIELDCTFEEFKMLTLLWDNVPYSEAQFVNLGLDKIGLGFFDFSDNEKEGMICTELLARVLHKWSKYKFSKDMDSIGLVDVKRVVFS